MSLPIDAKSRHGRLWQLTKCTVDQIEDGDQWLQQRYGLESVSFYSDAKSRNLELNNLRMYNRNGLISNRCLNFFLSQNLLLHEPVRAKDQGVKVPYENNCCPSNLRLRRHRRSTPDNR